MTAVGMGAAVAKVHFGNAGRREVSIFGFGTFYETINYLYLINHKSSAKKKFLFLKINLDNTVATVVATIPPDCQYPLRRHIKKA